MLPVLEWPGLDTSSIDGTLGSIIVFSNVVWVIIVLYALFSDPVSNWIGRYRLTSKAGRSAAVLKPGGATCGNKEYNSVIANKVCSSAMQVCGGKAGTLMSSGGLYI